jgi:HEPN domain-containing protein
MPWYSLAETPAKVSETFISGSIRFLAEAQKLRRAGPPDQAPEQMITFHALELSLKAFLIKKGFSPRTLARTPFGHNLLQLYAEAEENGLALRVAQPEYLFEWINEWHNAPARVRYVFGEEKTLPMCDVVFPIIMEIATQARDASASQAWQH